MEININTELGEVTFEADNPEDDIELTGDREWQELSDTEQRRIVVEDMLTEIEE